MGLSCGPQNNTTKPHAVFCPKTLWVWDGLQALWNNLILFSNTDKHEPFWVDALCIDQHNVSERNRQVNMMARIYSSAFKVAVWLGPATMDNDRACDLISKKGGSCVARHTVTQETLEALVALLGRPYWKRLWIVQEILLAKQYFFLMWR
jgi:hypothetical protein